MDINRRYILKSSTLALSIGLAGCTSSMRGGRATLDRLVLRADTGQTEQVNLTLVYAPHNDSTERPVWGSYEAPASGEPIDVDGFEGSPGFYSVTAHSRNHGSLETASFNSYGDAVGKGPLQFEIVVRESGDIWANINTAGEEITLPGN